MKNIAVHDGTTIRNVIVAESLEIAEAVTGLQAMETDGEPWIGWVNVDGEWVTAEPVAVDPKTGLPTGTP